MIKGLESRAPGLVLLAVGVGFFIGGRSYGVILEGRMGPGLMPTTTGALLVAFGSILAFIGEPNADGREGGNASHDLGREPASEGSVGSQSSALATVPLVQGQTVDSHLRPWIILGLITGALLLAPVVGLIIALGLMTVVILRFVERESWRMTLGVTVGCLGGAWLIFVQLLSVPMPNGIFGGS